MGIFDALQDSDEENSSSEGHESDEDAVETSAEVHEENNSVDEADGWVKVSQKGNSHDGFEGDVDACLVCSKPFSNKHRSTVIPCSITCNKEAQIHVKCLKNWRLKSETCILCRAPLLLPTRPEKKDVSEDDLEDGVNALVYLEVDAKNRRRNPAVRNNRTNTYKAAKQRQFSMDKRNAQRAAAKSSQWLEEEE